MGVPQEAKDAIAAPCMFFAGLILLIPHRIGMSRVNYVIKRYNLPISRAGLLLYKYHNNIELSLLFGTLPGNIIVWIGGSKKWQMWIISIFMIVFLSLMLISSIYMYNIYISGGDFGHLNSFYFSLIFLTFFDGFTNAFAFGINAKFSSMLSAGIPLSGLLVTLLHYIYKSYSEKFLLDDFEFHTFKYDLDDFDYHVLRLQLLWNIIFISFTLVLWIVDMGLKIAGDDKAHEVAPIEDLFNNGGNDHTRDFSPILLLAISLGTVYAFYPSIAPYSIIDFQYASVIELWILVISALLPFTFALLDKITNNFGPSGRIVFLTTIFTLQVTHKKENPSAGKNDKIKHGGITCGQPAASGAGDNSDTTAHDYGTHNPDTNNDKYNQTGTAVNYPEGKPVILNNWFQSCDEDNNTVNKNDPLRSLWNCVWICAIFYILCIQIFMSLLHYPDCLLSCFFNNNPYFIVFISILFNTLREVMQACGFAGAGKQVITSQSNLYDTFASTNIVTSSPSNPSSGQAGVTLSISGKKHDGTTISTITLQASGSKIKVPKADYQTNNKIILPGVNGTIASTNKLITLFVMMFCVFTGDGYLQHYRRCCRDCWPTTGYNKYQSFFYWLHFGFKGGIKSITSSFTDLKYHNLRPQFISYA